MADWSNLYPVEFKLEDGIAAGLKARMAADLINVPTVYKTAETADLKTAPYINVSVDLGGPATRQISHSPGFSLYGDYDFTLTLELHVIQERAQRHKIADVLRALIRACSFFDDTLNPHLPHMKIQDLKGYTSQHDVGGDQAEDIYMQTWSGRVDLVAESVSTLPRP